ncbi:hypothetical protein COP2_008282 [Malus domestica]
MAALAAGTRPPWVGLGAAVWVQIAAGTAFTFPLYSHSLKSVLGFNQKQLTMLVVANDIGENVGLIPGILSKKHPPWLILLIGALACFFGYGIIWLTVSSTILPRLTGCLCSTAGMPLSGVLNEEKPKGSKVWSLKPQPTTMVDGDKNGDRTGSCTTTKVKTSCQSSKMKEFNSFKDNLQCLWDNLVGECQHGPLFDQILLKCMDYITALSCSSSRTYRQAATWRALQLIASFISVANTLATRRETTRIQLNAEQKIETQGHRVESLNKRLSMTHDKITTLEQMMCKISKGVIRHYRLLVHCYRYREIDPNIWISCTESLGVWIISYPSLFLQDVYLKYIGLALKDTRAGVRNAFVHALKNVCEIDANVPSLGRFTGRFSSQMIALSSDIDTATGPVKQLLR